MNDERRLQCARDKIWCLKWRQAPIAVVAVAIDELNKIKRDLLVSENVVEAHTWTNLYVKSRKV